MYIYNLYSPILRSSAHLSHLQHAGSHIITKHPMVGKPRYHPSLDSVMALSPASTHKKPARPHCKEQPKDGCFFASLFRNEVPPVFFFLVCYC